MDFSGYISGTPQYTTGAKAGFSTGVALLGQSQEYTASHGFRTVDLGGSRATFDGGVSYYTTFFWNPAAAQVARVTLSPVANTNTTNLAIVLTNQEGASTSLVPAVPAGHVAAPKGSGSIKDGCTYILMIKQDATGGRSVVWDDRIRWSGGGVAGVSTGANTQTNCFFVSDGNFLYGTASYNYATT
ncbi:MAG: hypothetical protein EBU96_01125 [Actinobacteria bacterium]|nr:hypothetical protein [Actinomycetota bacterium]